MPKTSYDVPSARKAIGLIELLCEAEVPLGVPQISKELGLNTNMTFRLLQTLVKAEWVTRVNGTRYQMGLRPFHHIRKPVQRMDLQVTAMKHLTEFWRQVGESVYLCVPDNNKALCLIHLDARGPVRISAQVGGYYDLHSTAPGKVLLAYGDETMQKSAFQKTLTRHTDQTLCTRPKLLAELEDVRKHERALDREESARGLLCFAVPVRNYTGQVVGTIGISVLSLFYSEEELSRKLGPSIVAIGHAISRELGAPPPLDFNNNTGNIKGVIKCNP